jgi:hypothetical protein
MMKTLSSSETSVLTRATRRNILEDAILHNCRREILKSYETNSVAFCPQANYTDWATATSRWNLVWTTQWRVWENGNISPPFLTSALDRLDWWNSPSFHSNPKEGTSCTNSRGGWGDFWGGMDVMRRRNLLFLPQNRNQIYCSPSP